MQKGEKVPYFPNYLITAGEHGEHSCPYSIEIRDVPLTDEKT